MTDAGKPIHRGRRGRRHQGVGVENDEGGSPKVLGHVGEWDPGIRVVFKVLFHPRHLPRQHSHGDEVGNIVNGSDLSYLDNVEPHSDVQSFVRCIGRGFNYIKQLFRGRVLHAAVSSKD